MTWVEEVFGKKKAIIGLCHLKALPGDPNYDKKGGIEAIYEAALYDVIAMQNGKIDGIQFTNEFSIPYDMKKVSPRIVAAMAYIIGRLKKHITVPFGVNCIGDTESSIALCAITGAKFTRGSFHGTWATNHGIITGECANAYKLRKLLEIDNLKLVHYVMPENSADIAGRDPVVSLKSHYFLNKPDSIGVCGLVAGQKVDVSLLERFRKEFKDAVIFAVTGVNENNVDEILSIADAAFVGTSIKKDSVFENPVDENRVLALMEKVDRMC